MLLAGKRFCALALTIVALLLAFAPVAAAANKPIVVTFDAVVSDSGVTLKGAILGDDGQRVTESGFYYGQSQSALSSKAKADSAYELEVTLKQLEPSTTYYVQAYAQSSAGEGLGEIVQFKTAQKAAQQQGQSQTLSEAAVWADKIKSEYGIQIHYKAKRNEWNHLATYKLVENESDAVAGMKMIYDGLSRYPKGFISRVKLQYIALASEIKAKDGTLAFGMALGNKLQTSLLIMASAKEQTLHHELYHAFGYAFEIRVNDWDKANIKPKLYDDDASMKKEYDLLFPGFISRYAMTMPEEDRAELFMYLMTDSLKGQLVDTAAHDPCLRDKIKRLSTVLEKNLGKLASGSKWSATAAAAMKASTKKLGVAYTSVAAKLYEGPDTQAFSSVKEVPQGTQLDVVQTGSLWHKVLYEGQPYYVLASSASFTRADALEDNNSYDMLAQRLQKNYGVSVSVLNTKADFENFSAGDVRDLKGAVALVAEYESLLQGGVVIPDGITNLVVCRTIRKGSESLAATMKNNVLYISQEIELGGQLRKSLEDLRRQQSA